MGGSWVGDFQFAIWVSVCRSCVDGCDLGWWFSICSLFARCWFVVGLLAVGLGLLVVGLGFAWFVMGFARCGYGFLVLNVDGGLWVTGGGGVKCVLQHICLDEHLKSCSTINLAS